MNSTRPITILFLTIYFIAGSFLAVCAFPLSLIAQTSCISLGMNGTTPNGSASSAVISLNQSIAFSSSSTNISSVTARTDRASDTYVFNRSDGSYRIVNRSGTSQPNSDHGQSPSISDDGQIVAFSSSGDTIVSPDTNSSVDIFVRDLSDTQIRRVSVSSSGQEADGRSSRAVVSGNGRFVFFVSSASKLVEEDTNSSEDIFRHDRVTGETKRVNLLPGEIQSSSATNILGGVSSDGRWVVFEESVNFNLSVYLRDVELGSTILIAANGASSTISRDGRFVAFDNEVGRDTVFFLYDRLTGLTSRICSREDPTSAPFPEGSIGYTPESSISDDGRYLAYAGIATTERNGERVKFADILVCDTQTKTVYRPVVAPDGARLNGSVGSGIIAGDASRVVFTSNSTNLVTTPTNGTFQVYSTEIDLCPDDTSKSLPAICGCGISDNDSNANGAADCLDPNSTIKPTSATVTVKKKAASIVMQSFPGSGISYVVTLTRVGNGKVSKSVKTFKSSSATYRNLAVGSYKLSYLVKMGSVKTKISANASFVIKASK